MKPVIVIGHKNPDSDSICSAICYANLKQKITGREHIPCRAGEINNETKYILERFGVEPPQLIETLAPTLADVQYRQIAGISSHMSLRKAWEYMRDNDVPTVPVVLFTSTKDNVIPIEANAQAAYNKMKAAGAKNVTLIMDDFGDHIAAQTKFFEYLTNQGYRE